MNIPSLLNLMTTLAQAPPDKPAIVKPSLVEVSKNASSDGLIPIHWLLIAVGGIIVLLCGLSIANWWKHRDEHFHPLLVFSATAGQVGLGYRYQWALLRIAHRQSLGSPLTLMLSPGTFDHHAKAYLETCLAFRRESVRRQLNQIRAHLFDDSPAHGAIQPASSQVGPDAHVV